MPWGSVILIAGLGLIDIVGKGKLPPTEKKITFLIGILFIFVGALSIAVNNFTIIILIIGFALIIGFTVNPFIARKSSEKARKPSEKERELIFTVVVVLIFAGMVPLVYNYSNVSPTPDIRITYPLSAATVNVQENVAGTAKNIPEGDEIWILVHPHNVNKYYPQRSSAVIQNGEWSLAVGIGSESDAGKEFDIIAVLADSKTQEEINKYFDDCEETGKWPGMDKVPDNAKEYDRITVKRLPVTPEIQITDPVDGAKVSVTESVKGKQKNVPSDKAIWIIVFPYVSNNYHPIKAVPVHNDISDFTVPVTMGTEKNSGDKFDIIAVLADEESQKLFTDYLETAADRSWPGMDLPDGAIEYDRVTVTRK